MDVGAELAQKEHGERGRADPVGVVVAVDADRVPPAIAEVIPSTACRMSPRANGSCPGSAALRNARGAPRVAVAATQSTEASTSLTP